MAKKKNRGGGGKSLVRSVEKLAKGTALAGPAVYKIATSPNMHGFAGAVYDYTGFNLETGEFRLAQLVHGWGPYVAVEGGTRIAHKVIGLIRSL